MQPVNVVLFYLFVFFDTLNSSKLKRRKCHRKWKNHGTVYITNDSVDGLLITKRDLAVLRPATTANRLDSRGTLVTGNPRKKSPLPEYHINRSKYLLNTKKAEGCIILRFSQWNSVFPSKFQWNHQFLWSPKMEADSKSMTRTQAPFWPRRLTGSSCGWRRWIVQASR